MYIVLGLTFYLLLFRHKLKSKLFLYFLHRHKNKTGLNFILEMLKRRGFGLLNETVSETFSLSLPLAPSFSPSLFLFCDAGDQTQRLLMNHPVAFSYVFFTGPSSNILKMVFKITCLRLVR